MHCSGRILPQLGPASTEAPPGFNTTGSFSLQPRGIGHGEQVTTRKMGWEMLLPSGPSPPHAPPPYATPVLFPPTLGMVGPEVAATSSVSTGIMKDISLFKNPFDVPRDQLLRWVFFFVFLSCLSCLDPCLLILDKLLLTSRSDNCQWFFCPFCFCTVHFYILR